MDDAQQLQAWRGVAWRGVAWRGVAWRGVAWRSLFLILPVVIVLIIYLSWLLVR
jgi:hypothetical protein